MRWPLLFDKTTNQLSGVVSSPIAGPCGGMDAATEPPRTDSRRVPRAVRAPRPRPDVKVAKRSRYAHSRRLNLVARYEQITSSLTASSGSTPRPRRCNRLRLMARHLQSCGMTARPAARDSACARLQSVGVAFGRHVVVCRAVLVGRGEDCTMAFVSFNGRFFRMSRDVASPPGEFVHRSGFIAANTATWSHAAGYVLHAAHLATSLRVAGMDLPHQPLLSPACDGQP
ncbi:hypothetical protein FHT03_004083 [Xanthomonas arboricola]